MSVRTNLPRIGKLNSGGSRIFQHGGRVLSQHGGGAHHCFQVKSCMKLKEIGSQMGGVR